MARRRGSNFRYLFLALSIAMLLWGLAHGGSSSEQAFDIPVVFQDVPDELVVTDQNVDAVNVRVLGSRAALRNVSLAKTFYEVDVSGAKPGPAVYEVNGSQVDLPGGTRIVSRSPASILVQFERRGRKSVRIRPDLEGDPASGFTVTSIEVDPPRVWLAGARSDVLRLTEVVTETVDVSGLAESAEREVRLSLRGAHIWMEKPRPVKVLVQIDPVPGSETEVGATAEEPAGA